MEVNAHGSDCPHARAMRQLRLRSGTSMKRFLAVLLLMPSIAVAATDAAPTFDLKAAERVPKLAPPWFRTDEPQKNTHVFKNAPNPAQYIPGSPSCTSERP